jgi:hypothetical protein
MEFSTRSVFEDRRLVDDPRDQDGSRIKFVLSRHAPLTLG